MSAHSVNSATFELPEGLSFVIPRDYAAYCEGTIVSVHAAENEVDGLCVSWDSELLSFQHCRAVVKYRAGNVLRLLLDLSERLEGQTICTLRVLFREEEGTAGTLPVISCATGSARLLMTLANELMNSTFPYRTEIIDDSRP